MTRHSARFARLLLAASVAVACFAGLSTAAYGVPGDSEVNATLLNTYFGSSLTTELIGSPTGLYYFKVDLQAGETLQADFTSSPDALNLQAVVFAPAPYSDVWAVGVGPLLTRLTFKAPITSMYSVYVPTSGTGTFTVEPAIVYIVTPTAGANGIIAPGRPQAVPRGADKTFTITANPGYHIAIVLKDGVSIGAVSTVTFSNVTTDHAFSATFAANTYTVTPTTGPNGTISPGTAQTVSSGGDKTFTITANPGYHIVDVLKDGVSIGAVSTVTFVNVTDNHTVSATFAANPIATYVITPTAGVHGTISPLTQQIVDSGSDTTFTITANPGYHIASVLKDGVSIGAVSTVVFVNVTTDHTLVATFAITSNVMRVDGSDRFAVAAGLARKGWDPANTKAWPGVTDVIVANGENGKEADPLSAAGLAGAYNAPVLLTGTAKLPDSTRIALREIAAKRKAEGGTLRVHLVGGKASVPDARWNEIRAIPGVNASKDRLEGADRYAVSAAIATRIVSRVGLANVPGVILIAADDTNAFYDALAISPASYSRHMPMLAVRKGLVPLSISSVLSGTFAGKPRYAASSSTYIAGSLSGATRLTNTDANRYTAAYQISNAAIAQGWLSPLDVGISAKLPDALTGGTFVGKRGGVMLFTDSSSTIQSASRAFITAHKAEIGNGWIFGGTGSVPSAQQTSFLNLLK